MSRENWLAANPPLSACRRCGVAQGCGCELDKATKADLWKAYQEMYPDE